VWSDGLEPYRRSTGEVTVRAGGLRTNAVPGTTDALRQAAVETSFTADRLGTSH